MNALGLDIGGANLKAAHTDGTGKAIPFEFWKRKADFPRELNRLLSFFPEATHVGVTMTAEIADCFTSKAEGVRYICEALLEVVESKPLQIWTTSGEFVAPSVAIEFPQLVAAANWHALATWLGRLVPEGNALLIDIGSTTTDLIPLCEGRPESIGLTDLERLVSRELVYSGVWRTPLFALAEHVPLRETTCPLAPELFATTLDLYLLSGQIAERADCNETADRRPATKLAAIARLARMLCCDRTELSDAELLHIAEYLRGRQRAFIVQAIEQVLQQSIASCSEILVSGSGSFLAEEVIAGLPYLNSVKRIVINDLFDSAIAESACAFAVANLAAERQF